MSLTATVVDLRYAIETEANAILCGKDLVREAKRAKRKLEKKLKKLIKKSRKS